MFGIHRVEYMALISSMSEVVIRCTRRTFVRSIDKQRFCSNLVEELSEIIAFSTKEKQIASGVTAPGVAVSHVRHLGLSAKATLVVTRTLVF